MKIISVVGARPNFMKIAPFIRAIERHNQDRGMQIEHLLVHTGQHYDHRMSQAFFEALDLPPADIHLGVGSGSHAEQVGNTMIAFEKVLMKEKPDWVVVPGDVNATLACTLAAKKLQISCCHIEAGLRSGDMRMPEEVNRVVTDRLSDLLLTPDTFSVENLKKEGVPGKKIHFVGNIMVDTLEAQRGKAESLSLKDILADNLLDPGKSCAPLADGSYALMTLHRPSNVDQREVFEPLISFLCEELSADLPLLWPVHPRAKMQLEAFGLWEKVAGHPRIFLLHPLGYHEMSRLNMDARIVLTDSGGLQSESCVYGTPCLTLRENTEWLVTLRENGGAAMLVGNRIPEIRKAFAKAIHLEKKPRRPERWDGQTAGRCLEAILTG